MTHARYIGIDLGGTKIQVAAADAQGAIIARTRSATPESLAEGLALLQTMIAEVAAGAPIAGVGVAIGGPIHALSGVVSPLHQAQWRDVPLGELLATWTGAPWRIEVDTDAAAMAEYCAGGHKVSRLLYITVSTGVGGGFVIDGAIQRGAGGAHPEFGHQVVTTADPVVCGCGATGCLESLVSGRALERRHGRPAAELTDAEFAAAGKLLGLGLRNAATLLSPDLIALGGGVVVGGGERLLAAARAEVAQGVRLVPAPRIVVSALGYDTALRGSLVLAAAAAGRMLSPA
jgi:predicted NBD/HSP70 family sugar kinase